MAAAENPSKKPRLDGEAALPALPEGPVIYNQLVLLGDSLFQFSSKVSDGFSFHGAIQDLCMRRLDVINRGFSGWNTKNVVRYLEKIFPPRSEATPRIEYLLVLLGANDAALELDTASQHVDEEDYRSNLKTIITHPNITAHSPKILLVTPPPLDEIMAEMQDKEKHGQAVRQAAVSAKYSDIARQVAADVPGTVLIDLQKAIMEAAIAATPDLDDKGLSKAGLPLGYPGSVRGGLEQMLPDGLHMSGQAYRVFFDAVKEHIGPFPEDNETGFVLPGWRKTNPVNHKGEKIYEE
ncbi:hypothetical protein PG991_003596 [Apiospora marii]|uniref:SGNH hydrolase-type esterase domain-containing protein n=1 Tax=Apiospora marii TaxID=335849 RepID=A0ABR1S3U2_9PEZI